MMFIVTGASGSGKSACLPGLRATFPSIDWRDFDEFGVPSPCPREWRPRTTERWLQVALNNHHRGQDTLACSVARSWVRFWPAHPRRGSKFVLLFSIARMLFASTACGCAVGKERRKRCSHGLHGRGYMPSIRSGGSM